jgi:hypothetical protein
MNWFARLWFVPLALVASGCASLSQSPTKSAHVAPRAQSACVTPSGQQFTSQAVCEAVRRAEWGALVQRRRR